MVKRKKYRPEVVAAVSALGSMIAIGTVSYHYIEGWTWIKSLYFVVATLTTVGYGDVHPTTEFSRLFTVFFILIGVSIAVASIAVIGGRYLEKRETKVIARTKKVQKNG